MKLDFKYKRKLSQTEMEVVSNVLGVCTMFNLESHLTGSGIVKDGEGWSNDLDIAILDDNGKAYKWLCSRGFKKGGSMMPSTSFDSLKREATFDGMDINVILCKDEKVYRDYFDASSILEVAQLKNKHDRIALFQHMRGEIKLSPDKFADLATGTSIQDECAFSALPF